MNVITKTVQLPDGREISIETGKLAKQADGAVMLRMGNTMLLATVCAAQDAVPGTDFMPLQVEYRVSPVASRSAKVRLTMTKSSLVASSTVRSVLSSPATTMLRCM